jgi:hypothetical protein
MAAVGRPLTSAFIRIVIHRFSTFLWMEVLSIRSDVLYLSRAEKKKDGSVEW